MINIQDVAGAAGCVASLMGSELAKASTSDTYARRLGEHLMMALEAMGSQQWSWVNAQLESATHILEASDGTWSDEVKGWARLGIYCVERVRDAAVDGLEGV